MRWVALALGVLLLLTNAFWLYQAVDHGVSRAYREQACTESEEALTQALATLRQVRAHVGRKDILQAARTSVPQFGEPFDKEGALHAGRLSFKLDAGGHLIAVEQE